MINYIIYLVCTTMGLVLMKLGKGKFFVSLKSGSLNFEIGTKVLLALFLYLTSFLLWIKIVGKNDISYIIPLTSAITNIIIFIIGVYFFKEDISFYKIIGIVFASVGIFFINK